MSAPVITFLTDYGLQDDFVGICHGVIARICPEARVIDLTHGIPRQDVRAGAMAFAGALQYMPPGILLGVVDPDVGASRRAVALELAGGWLAVGPDNGLFSLVAASAGGVRAAVDIAHSLYRLEPVAATFHGRDIFAPIAAHLAAGVPLAEVGRPLDPAELVTLELSSATVSDGVIVARAIYADGFGNVQLDAGHEQLDGSGLKLGQPVQVSVAGGDAVEIKLLRTFAEAARGELLLYEDAYRRLALAVSHGSARERLGLAVGDEVRIAAA